MTKELADRYGHEFFDMSGQAVATELSAAMKKYRDVLRNNEEVNTAFDLMEEDLQQVMLLDETCHLLIDALNVLSAEYKKGTITRKDVVELLHISPPQAYRLLKKMVDEEELIVTGNTSAAKYTCP